MTVSLRDARHAPQQRAWLERSYANWLTEFTRRRVTADEATQGLAEWFGDRRNIVMLLMRDGLPAGFSVFACLSLPSLDAFRMQEFYVEPAMRRRGVGRAVGRRSRADQRAGGVILRHDAFRAERLEQP